MSLVSQLLSTQSSKGLYIKKKRQSKSKANGNKAVFNSPFPNNLIGCYGQYRLNGYNSQNISWNIDTLKEGICKKGIGNAIFLKRACGWHHHSAGFFHGVWRGWRAITLWSVRSVLWDPPLIPCRGATKLAGKCSVAPFKRMVVAAAPGSAGGPGPLLCRGKLERMQQWICGGPRGRTPTDCKVMAYPSDTPSIYSFMKCHLLVEISGSQENNNLNKTACLHTVHLINSMENPEDE